ncbi:outer membrane lipoprotein [Pulveribacter suum]|uniref:Glycine zipper 2TM domain-containing protein n=1 Tax=Pulveribacter suum TaxID=2116657 RepID=A0A2P1NN80_9BURK|nr:glycine zipper 2TM domain-containing protein [Pulveribacter suum]AVP58519.1 hypothetical protein C7H73_13155 [Pulveribacter suum]
MRKYSRIAAIAGTISLAGALAACADAPRYGDQPYYPGQQSQAYPNYDSRATEYGSVSHIEGLHARNRTSGAGAVLGAVVGGVLGNQVGGGSGRLAATAVGAVGGALAGNAIESRNDRTDFESYRITIQLDRGGQRVYEVPATGDLRTGDRVRLYNGQISRV